MMAKPEAAELSGRDAGILEDLHRVRLLSGRQLERLHFGHLATPNARGSARRRTLGRLVDGGLVTTLPRRVGGERAGSAGLIYTLDARGQRWFMDSQPGGRAGRIRRLWSIGWPFVQHSLDVAELYVRLRQLQADGSIKLLQFDAEPACWYATPRGRLKPDAWAVYETADWEEHWWLEVDRGTESLPTLERKLRYYVEFAVSGRPGPLGVVPRVALTTPTPARLQAVRSLIDLLPAPANQLIEPVAFGSLFSRAARPPP